MDPLQCGPTCRLPCYLLASYDSTLTELTGVSRVSQAHDGTPSDHLSVVRAGFKYGNVPVLPEALGPCRTCPSAFIEFAQTICQSTTSAF